MKYPRNKNSALFVKVFTRSGDIDPRKCIFVPLSLSTRFLFKLFSFISPLTFSQPYLCSLDTFDRVVMYLRFLPIIITQ